MNEFAELIPVSILIVLVILAVIGRVIWKFRKKTAAEATAPVDEVAQAVEDAAMAELEKREPNSKWTRALQNFRQLFIVLLIFPALYSCAALTAATDAYKAVTGAQDTVVHVHRFDTVRVKIECDSTR